MIMPWTRSAFRMSKTVVSFPPPRTPEAEKALGAGVFVLENEVSKGVGHCSPDHGMLVELGLNGIAREIEEHIAVLKSKMAAHTLSNEKAVAAEKLGHAEHFIA